MKLILRFRYIDSSRHFLPGPARRLFERDNVDKFEMPAELQYTIVNMEETILDQ